MTLSGSVSRIELPLTAKGQTGCGCCSAAGDAAKAPAGPGDAYLLEGLTCGHCVQTVERAVSALDAVESASVELVPGGVSRLTVTGSASRSSIESAVKGAGYALTASR